MKKYLKNTYIIKPKKIKDYQKLLYTNLLDFLNDYFKVNLNITLIIKSPSKEVSFGYIDLIEATKGNYKIMVEEQLNILSEISHEFTHLVQIKRWRLSYSKAKDYITWLWKKYISLVELDKIDNIIDHQKLPWENEAYKIQDIIVQEYLKSSDFIKIKNKDPNICFLYQNNALL